jgi:peptide/nickel transport system permease protein
MARLRPYPIPTRKSPPRPEFAPLLPQRPLRRNLTIYLALAGLLTIALAGLGADFLAPYDPLAVDPAAQLQPPGWQHLAGTDLFGRDIFSRILHGARHSLAVGLVAMLISSLIGSSLGLLAGYYGGFPDAAIMRCMDVLLAFPGILLALALVAALGSGELSVMVAVGLSGVPAYTRLVRGSTLGIRREAYVRAAQAVGCGNLRILLRHILPNVAGPVLVMASLQMGWAILNAAALSFLGLGAQPPSPEWGAMLSEGRGYLRQAPWMTAAPGLAIMITVLAVNLVGDGLRDALDPRLTV